MSKDYKNSKFWFVSIIVVIISSLLSFSLLYIKNKPDKYYKNRNPSIQDVQRFEGKSDKELEDLLESFYKETISIGVIDKEKRKVKKSSEQSSINNKFILYLSNNQEVDVTADQYHEILIGDKVNVTLYRNYPTEQISGSKNNIVLVKYLGLIK